ncbi:MAG: M23 family metallopeptidase, partial [Chloroflexota bacterium]
MYRRANPIFWLAAVALLSACAGQLPFSPPLPTLQPLSAAVETRQAQLAGTAAVLTPAAGSAAAPTPLSPPEDTPTGAPPPATPTASTGAPSAAASSAAAPTLAPGPSAQALPDRPAFLAWPLPPSTGLARISQYPNTAWTWRYLGLADGFTCPPMFGYLSDPAVRPYWRSAGLTEAQDQAQADPHQFEMVACYTDSDPLVGGHAGTDIKAGRGTPVYAAAAGRVVQWRDSGSNSMLVLGHCLGGEWDGAGGCAGGQPWYTTYMHLQPDPALDQPGLAVQQGQPLGAIYDLGINSHLHFEVGHKQRSPANYTNPWGADAPPWLGCLWLDPALCPDLPAEQRSLAYAAPDGQVYLQRGAEAPQPLPAPPGLLSGGVQQLLMWGERLVVVDGAGRLFVVDGALSPPGGAGPGWGAAAEGVQEVQAAGSRLAYLDSRRRLFVRQGWPEGSWAEQDTGWIVAYSLAAQRLGYISGRGELWIKQGALDQPWQALARQAKALQVIDSRIIYLDREGDLYANEGPPGAEFEPIAGEAAAFQATGD